VALAIGLTSCVIALGYVMLGLLPMILFTFGFLGGLLVWLMSRAKPDWRAIRLPFFLTLAAFVLHKLEERYLDFFRRYRGSPASARLRLTASSSMRCMPWPRHGCSFRSSCRGGRTSDITLPGRFSSRWA